MLDDVIYTPYVYDPTPPPSSPEMSRARHRLQTGDLLGIPELLEDGVQNGGADGDKHHAADEDEDEGAQNGDAGRKGKDKRRKKSSGLSKFRAKPTEAEIFIFKYGTVVIWGMTEQQEKRFLSSM